MLSKFIASFINTAASLALFVAYILTAAVSFLSVIAAFVALPAIYYFDHPAYLLITVGGAILAVLSKMAFEFLEDYAPGNPGDRLVAYFSRIGSPKQATH